MRHLLFLAIPFALAAQSAESDQRITQVLISEIQQLRLAIERSTLLNARTQLAISQFQLQETAVSRISQQLNEVKTQAAGMGGHLRQLAEAVKDAEQARTSPEFSDPAKH